MRRVLMGVVGLAAVAASCGRADVADAPDASPTDAAAPSPIEAGAVDASADDAALDGGVDADLPLVDTCRDAGPVPDLWLSDPHLCLSVYADAIGPARQMAFAPNGELFVESGGHVIATFDVDKNGVIDDAERSIFADAPFGGATLNHGLAFSPDGAFVYASGSTTVFRWSYLNGDHIARADGEVVVDGIQDNGHVTRTLLFDASGRLYVSVGSGTDVDFDSRYWSIRAMIRRFTLPSPLPMGGLTYDSGEVWASGLRNEVGLAIDSKGRVWGVENGSDGAYMPPDAQNDNPAEELNRLDAPGTRYFGFPQCWTEGLLDGGLGPGTQWAYSWPGAQDDAWCRDVANVQRPAWSMPAHWAPLGVTEYTGHSLPWRGDLFVTAHGSSYRTPPSGRLVARVHLVGDDVASVTPVVGPLGPDGGLQEGTPPVLRPVDVKTGPDGALYISDDEAMRIWRLGYRP